MSAQHSAGGDTTTGGSGGWSRKREVYHRHRCFTISQHTAFELSFSNLPRRHQASKHQVFKQTTNNTTSATMRVVSTSIFVIAALAASATAASLDVEPIALTPVTTTAPADLPAIVNNPSSPNATSNLTSGHKIGAQAYRCNGMNNADWSTVKYACVWIHNSPDVANMYFNQFFQRYDGSVTYQCNCDQALYQYDPWGPRWRFSANIDGKVICYTSNGMGANTAQHVFANYNC